MNFEGRLKRTPPVCPNRACHRIHNGVYDLASIVDSFFYAQQHWIILKFLLCMFKIYTNSIPSLSLLSFRFFFLPTFSHCYVLPSIGGDLHLWPLTRVFYDATSVAEFYWKNNIVMNNVLTSCPWVASRSSPLVFCNTTTYGKHFVNQFVTDVGGKYSLKIPDPSPSTSRLFNLAIFSNYCSHMSLTPAGQNVFNCYSQLLSALRN